MTLVLRRLPAEVRVIWGLKSEEMGGAGEEAAKTERATRQQGSSLLGRIVPTEAKPSELSACIVGAGAGSVKEKTRNK
jgi:hypothetical protein